MPSSLHYINPGFDLNNQNTFNGYQKVVVDIADVVLTYDSDKLVPMYGFGAFFQGQGTVNHCFPMFAPNMIPNGVEALFTC